MSISTVPRDVIVWVSVPRPAMLLSVKASGCTCPELYQMCSCRLGLDIFKEVFFLCIVFSVKGSLVHTVMEADFCTDIIFVYIDHSRIFYHILPF